MRENAPLMAQNSGAAQKSTQSDNFLYFHLKNEIMCAIIADRIVVFRHDCLM